VPDAAMSHDASSPEDLTISSSDAATADMLRGGGGCDMLPNATANFVWWWIAALLFAMARRRR
jgi:hypothetical protein